MVCNSFWILISSTQKKFLISYQVIHHRNESVTCVHERRQSSQSSKQTATNKLTSNSGLEKVKTSCGINGAHHLRVFINLHSFVPPTKIKVYLPLNEHFYLYHPHGGDKNIISWEKSYKITTEVRRRLSMDAKGVLTQYD